MEQRKRITMLVKNVALAAKWKNARELHHKIMGFETKVAVSSNMFLHDNDNFRPQKLNMKIKE